MDVLRRLLSRRGLALSVAVGLTMALLGALLPVTPAAGQQADSGHEQLVEQYSRLKERAQRVKARWLANPNPSTRAATTRVRDRISEFADRNGNELLHAFDMLALQNPAAQAPKVNTDSFGYTARDDVPYDFIDLSDNQDARILTFGDDISVAVDLEEPFEFYGTTVGTLVMDTNGYVHTWFGGFTRSDFTNDCPLPTTGSSSLGNNDAAMFGLWDDLTFRSIASGVEDLDESGMYVQHFADCPRPNDIDGASEGCTVFMWDNAREFGFPTNTLPDWDMEIITYHRTNQWVFQITDGHPSGGSSATTGSQNFDASVHLQWDCNEAGYLPGQTAIGVFPPGTGPMLPVAAASSSVEPELPSILTRPPTRRLRQLGAER